MLYRLHRSVALPEAIIGAESRQACGMGQPAGQRQRDQYQAW